LAWMRRFRMVISVAGAALTVVGVVGLVAHLGTTSAVARTVTTQTTEDAHAFFASFTHAIRTGDVAFLTARLDPAVIDRYGSSECGRAVRKLADPTEALRLVGVSGPTTYAYTSDGRTTTVADTYVFHVAGTAGGTTGPRDYHFSLSGGTFHLFLDCGTPVPGS
jgi:hypothetical protein